jgi:hypothetical protein
MTRDKVEDLVKEKMAKYNEEMKLKDVEKKTLNLKIKSNRANKYGSGIYESPSEEATSKNNSDLKNDIDMLKLEIVKELRDARSQQVESNKQTETSMDRMSESLGLVL